jgi:hypothetical protein
VELDENYIGGVRKGKYGRRAAVKVYLVTLAHGAAIRNCPPSKTIPSFEMVDSMVGLSGERVNECLDELEEYGFLPKTEGD